MKRKNVAPRTALKAEIGVLQSIVTGLVARLGGEVFVSANDMSGEPGDRMEEVRSDEGVHLKLHRRVRLIS